jgi:hypothetical protein
MGLSHNKLQDRQFKYNVTMMGVCEIIVAVEKE